mgnify:CR=1 FL=1
MLEPTTMPIPIPLMKLVVARVIIIFETVYFQVFIFLTDNRIIILQKFGHHREIRFRNDWLAVIQPRIIEKCGIWTRSTVRTTNSRFKDRSVQNGGVHTRSLTTVTIKNKKDQDAEILVAANKIRN